MSTNVIENEDKLIGKYDLVMKVNKKEEVTIAIYQFQIKISKLKKKDTNYHLFDLQEIHSENSLQFTLIFTSTRVTFETRLTNEIILKLIEQTALIKEGSPTKYAPKIYISPRKREKELILQLKKQEQQLNSKKLFAAGYILQYKGNCAHLETTANSNFIQFIWHAINEKPDPRSFEVSAFLNKQQIDAKKFNYKIIDFPPIFFSLKYNLWFDKLNVSGVNNRDLVLLVADVIKVNQTLREIYLSDTGSTDGFIKLANGIKNNRFCRLEVLDLSKHNISDKEALIIFESLIDLPKFKKIWLNDCQISSKGVKKIFHLINENPDFGKSLELINLSNNNFDKSGTKAKSIQHANSLKKLNLSNTKLNNESIECILEAINENSNLANLTLNLSSNQIGKIGATQLKDKITDQGKIKKLILNNCNLGSKGIINLISAFAENDPVSHLSIGNSIRKRDCTIEELEKVVLKYLKTTSKLTYLDFSSNKKHLQIGKKFESIFSSLSNNVCLKTLKIEGNNISDPEFKILCRSLIKNRTLTTLYYDDNNLTIDSIKQFFEMIEINQTLFDSPLPTIILKRIKKKDSSILDNYLTGIKYNLKRNLTKYNKNNPRKKNKNNFNNQKDNEETNIKNANKSDNENYFQNRSQSFDLLVKPEDTKKRLASKSIQNFQINGVNSKRNNKRKYIKTMSNELRIENNNIKYSTEYSRELDKKMPYRKTFVNITQKMTSSTSFEIIESSINEDSIQPMSPKFKKAIETENLNEIKKLIKNKKANLFMIDEKTESSALHLICSIGNPEILSFFLFLCQNSPMVLNKPDRRGMTTLHRLVVSNLNHECLILLKDYDVDFNARDKRRWTPLQLCIHGYSNDHNEKKRIETISYILKHGKADVSIVDSKGCSALHTAAEDGFFAVLPILIKQYNANVNLQDNKGATPLHKSARNGHIACVEYFLKNGSDTNIKDSNGYTPLDLARMFVQTEITKILDPIYSKVNISKIIWENKIQYRKLLEKNLLNKKKNDNNININNNNNTNSNNTNNNNGDNNNNKNKNKNNLNKDINLNDENKVNNENNKNENNGNKKNYEKNKANEETINFDIYQEYTICLLGSKSCGKSKLIERLLTFLFTDSYIPTIEKQYQIFAIINNKQILLNILDVSGDDIYGEFKSRWISMADGFVCGYSVEKRHQENFENLEGVYFEPIKNHLVETNSNIMEKNDGEEGNEEEEKGKGGNEEEGGSDKNGGSRETEKKDNYEDKKINQKQFPVVLISTKNDLEEKVIPKEMGEKLASKMNCPFIETSSKSNLNIELLFMLILSIIVNNNPNKPLLNIKDYQKKNNKSNSISNFENQDEEKSFKGFFKKIIKKKSIDLIEPSELKEPEEKNEEKADELVSITEILSSPLNVSRFVNFLKTIYGEENLMFYLAVNNFKQIDSSMDRLIKIGAKKIYEDFVKSGSPQQINVDHLIRLAIDKEIQSSDFNQNVFDRAHFAILKLLRNDCYPKFVNSKYYNQILK
ncbi:leucine-rich repeat [Anaeramoeba flamelloides]|uniref:Leucine-rich repeat n=1 Tax=Anaeramoeba flamelloides TaxID=1746091 RepID=A0ABQ8XYF6_9EUKA|nr:leucine-rich repeat [Anaeramoeba flamelloides]